MTDVVLRPPPRPFDAEMVPPGSKSLTNRALLLAALAEGASRLSNVLIAEDVRLMVEALRALGVGVRLDETARSAIVHGCGGRWPEHEASLYCGNAGTVARFLTGAVALGQGEYMLDGSARMRERPIEPLVAAITDLGAAVRCGQRPGSFPLTVSARGLRGGTVQLAQPDSSQFVSAVLMAAPLARGDVLIEVAGPLTSAPFVRMTLAMMERFGAAVVERDLRRFVVPGTQQYAGHDTEIEPDATAASYFFAAAALTGGRVRMPGLDGGSLQGDMAFLTLLESMGCAIERGRRHVAVTGPSAERLRGVDADLGEMPDVAPTLAVLAAFADGPTRIRNVANLRVKESDRIGALAAGLQRIGAEVEIHADGLTVRPTDRMRAAAIDTYDDHRIAMSFALAGLALDGLTLRNAECVGKTYPGFFDDWTRVTGCGVA